jgi:hypothetical protein
MLWIFVMPAKWCMDAPFMDLRMESRSIALSSLVDPGLRRDDGGFLLA